MRGASARYDSWHGGGSGGRVISLDRSKSGRTPCLDFQLGSRTDRLPGRDVRNGDGAHGVGWSRGGLAARRHAPANNGDRRSREHPGPRRARLCLRLRQGRLFRLVEGERADGPGVKLKTPRTLLPSPHRPDRCRDSRSRSARRRALLNHLPAKLLRTYDTNPYFK